MQNKVIIYTDGACLNNPGPGGIGVVMLFGENRKEISRGYRKTTNNRMELLAVIEALKALKRNDLPVCIYSDSAYVVQAINKGWVLDWERKNFKKKKNPDLWIEYLHVAENYQIEFKWVKSHTGIRENERCDVLAKLAAENPECIDDMYEQSESKESLFTC